IDAVFFFFPAEDGIRDFHVTGVQTCALPISGQIVGWLIMGVGILQVLFLANLIEGLWLLAIGWFLTQSAQASFLQLQMRRLLSKDRKSVVEGKRGARGGPRGEI